MEAELKALKQQLERLELENLTLKSQLAQQGWLADAIDTTDTTVVVTDPRRPGNPIVYASEGFERLTGYSLDETLGRNCRFLQGDDTAQPEILRLRDAVAAGEDVRVVLRNYRKDGSLFWNELYLTPVYREGELVNFVGVQSDVGDFIETERQRDLLGAAVEQADESILVTDAALEHPGPRIIYVNAAFERLTGYSRAEVLGQNPRILQGPRTDRRLMRRLRRTLEAGETFNGATFNYRKNGEMFVNEWNVAPVVRRGVVTHWVATQRDITERLELERLVLEVSALEQQRVAQDLHDILGQHLTGTAFKAATLARRLCDEGVLGATEDAEQIVTLVNGAITKTRGLARGLYPTEAQVQGLKDALEGLCKTSQDIFGMACSLTLSGEVKVSADETLHLYRIAQEALNNAFRHGQAKQLKVHWQEDSDGRSLSISDDGVGLGTGGVQSQGLGLRIMRYRAQLLGGTLSIGSGHGGEMGTVVRCTLPPGSAGATPLEASVPTHARSEPTV